MVDNKYVLHPHLRSRASSTATAYGLNWGLVGVGSDNSRGKFDNIAVQVLPPQITLDAHRELRRRRGQPVHRRHDRHLGRRGRPATTRRRPAAPRSACSTSVPKTQRQRAARLSAAQGRRRRPQPAAPASSSTATAPTTSSSSPSTRATDQVIIGHYTAKGGWVNDAVVRQDHRRAAPTTRWACRSRAPTVSVTLNGQAVRGRLRLQRGDRRRRLRPAGDFAAGELRRRAGSRPTTVRSQPAGGGSLLAVRADAGDESALDADAVASSIRRRGQGDGDLDRGARRRRCAPCRIRRRAASRLATWPARRSATPKAAASTIDRDAAGYGWSLVSLRRTRTMDLVTVVTHELGHLLGFEHDDARRAGRAAPRGRGDGDLLEARGFDADPDAAISDRAAARTLPRAEGGRAQASTSTAARAARRHGSTGSRERLRAWSADHSPLHRAQGRQSREVELQRLPGEAGHGEPRTRRLRRARQPALFGAKK